MAQVSMTVRMDSQLKQSFDALCSQFGMSANTAMNIFALVETKSWTTELETVGIIGNRKYTENKLRKEHKLNKRVKY